MTVKTWKANASLLQHNSSTVDPAGNPVHRNSGSLPALLSGEKHRGGSVNNALLSFFSWAVKSGLIRALLVIYCVHIASGTTPQMKDCREAEYVSGSTRHHRFVMGYKGTHELVCDAAVGASGQFSVVLYSFAFHFNPLGACG